MTPPISRRQLHPEGSRTDAALISTIIRDVCELEPADSDDPNTACVRVDDLRDILETALEEYDASRSAPDAQVGAIGLHALHAEPKGCSHVDQCWNGDTGYCMLCGERLPLKPKTLMQTDLRTECQKGNHIYGQGNICWFCKQDKPPQPPSAPSQSGEVAQPSSKRAPVQGYSAGIPWQMHLRAYDAYVKRYGEQEALIDLEGRNCRNGFHTDELDVFIPGWREELDERAQLQGELARLRGEAVKQEEEWQEVCRENDQLRDQLAALQAKSP